MNRNTPEIHRNIFEINRNTPESNGNTPDMNGNMSEINMTKKGAILKATKTQQNISEIIRN